MSRLQNIPDSLLGPLTSDVAPPQRCPDVLTVQVRMKGKAVPYSHLRTREVYVTNWGPNIE